MKEKWKKKKYNGWTVYTKLDTGIGPTVKLILEKDHQTLSSLSEISILTSPFVICVSKEEI